METLANNLQLRNQVAILDDVQRTFLKSYTPVDFYNTSPEEIAEINRQLALSSYTNTHQLRSIRNAVVLLHRQGEMNFDGMLSVIAVIDRYMFNLNPESV